MAIGIGIAHWISRPIFQKPSTLTAVQVQQLRTLAGGTWLILLAFCRARQQLAAADHFQEAPNGVIAQRTSPTNIGLYLLTVLAAHALATWG